MPFVLKTIDHIDTPHTIYDPEMDKIDFISDPDQLKDVLPQPYRRIDKILNDLLDDTWDIIEKREQEKITEMNKPRPPKYENLFLLENVENISCICSSTDEDSKFLFVGANENQIHAVDASSLKICDQIVLEDGEKVVSINCSTIKLGVFFISAITENGYVSLYLFILGKFYPIQPAAEIDPERKTKFIKCELSEKSDYMALLVESKVNANEPLYIEVYKCAKDLWSQQIEAVIERTHKSKTDAELDTSKTTPEVVLVKPSLFCRMKSPQNLGKVQPVNLVNINQVLKATENSDMIGLGINHVLSKPHLDFKTEFAETIYNVELTETQPLVTDVNFKFIYPNRFIATSTSDQDVPNSLMVCWKNSNQLVFHPLSKIPKDMDSRIDYCIPFTDEIVHIDIARQSTLIAVSLKNNNVIIIDTIAGIDRRSVHLNVDSLKSIQFLPAYHGLLDEDFRNVDFQVRVTTQLICLADDGRVFIINSTVLSNTEPRVIYEPKYKNQDDKICLLLPCRNVPSLALAIGVTNKLYLLDIFKNMLVCELENHAEKDLVKLNELGFACKNTILFIKCANDNSNVSKLFAHTLRLIPKLEDYFIIGNDNLYSNSYLPNCGLNERMKILMRQRINEQFHRKDRLSINWSKLHEQKNI